MIPLQKYMTLRLFAPHKTKIRLEFYPVHPTHNQSTLGRLAQLPHHFADIFRRRRNIAFTVFQTDISLPRPLSSRNTTHI